MGAELDPYPSRHHFTPLSTSRPGKKYTWLFKDKLVKAIAALASPPLCRIDFLLTKTKKRKEGENVSFLPQLKAAMAGLGNPSFAFIDSASGAIQTALTVNTFARHSDWRKRRLQYISTSKFIKMLHLRGVVRQSSERACLSVGLSEAAMWAAGWRLEDRQASSWTFQHARFPQLLSSLVVSHF